MHDESADPHPDGTLPAEFIDCHECANRKSNEQIAEQLDDLLSTDNETGTCRTCREQRGIWWFVEFAKEGT